ncbi:MAG TPA: OsmC family protein [Actinomycetota bacterium]|nr:OsmC family protein [Actinomycetota bacterium]
MRTINVRAEGSDRYSIRIGAHTLVVDQLINDGGTDRGPTPTDLFVASLASCTAHYAGRFLRRHGLGADGLEVSCSFEMAEDRPARVGSISLDVGVPEGVPPHLSERFRAVIEHCTVKNSIVTPPRMHLHVSATDRSAA